MAKTIQSVSHILVEAAGTRNASFPSSPDDSEEPELEDNLRLLASVVDSLDILYTGLNKLDCVLGKKIIELKIKQQQKEKHK